MGHERVGMLPKTKRWRRIVGDLSSASLSPSASGIVASRTLENVRKQYEKVFYDEGVIAAFKFLVALSVFSKDISPDDRLREIGINIPTKPTPLAVTRAAHLWVSQFIESSEYGRIAQYAVGDALAQWHQSHSPQNATLFDLPEIPYGLWSKASNGAGFCELSRLFFAKFTERYLNFFLEREASTVVASINEREAIKKNIREHVDSISQHAFETSKITQSFAAGWFNKNAIGKLPDDTVIENFLSHAFEKMREEINREAEADVRLS
jgi:hypothetical protein